MINVSFQHVELVKDYGRRYNASRTISGPEDVAGFVKEVYHTENLSEEVFCILCLNTKNRIIGVQEVSRGSLSASIVHPREVFKMALLHNSAAIILFHNHPSGNTEPSSEDINTTNRLVKCGELMSIPVLDHVIVGYSEYDLTDGYTSLKEKGIIK